MSDPPKDTKLAPPTEQIVTATADVGISKAGVNAASNAPPTGRDVSSTGAPASVGSDGGGDGASVAIIGQCQVYIIISFFFYHLIF